jgi:hypothetical protein
MKKKNLKDVVMDGDKYETSEVSVESNTKLEDDKGKGREVILRFFEYVANPDEFKNKTPTPQALFNAHHREMEIKLWQDGLVPDPVIDPRLILSKDRTHYKFVIGCRLGKGQILTQTPVTLSELAK